VTTFSAQVGSAVQLSIKVRVLALLAVLFFTLAVGFANSLNVEYGGTYTTFLFLPEDLHADLIKTALSFPPFPPIDDSAWNPLYQQFHRHNPYGGLAEARQGGFTDLHLPPLVILIMLGLKRAILWGGPSLVVAGYYALALSAVVLLAVKFGDTLLESFLIFIVLTLSYPFLMILSRGSFGALFTSLPLMGLIYEVLAGKSLLRAAFYLALAVNFRPNAALLFPIFLTFGGRGFLKATSISGIVAGLLALASYLLSQHFYPGYDYAVFQKAMRAYSQYQLSMREASMNSLFGLLLPALDALHLPAATAFAAAGGLALACTGACSVLVVLLVWVYWRGHIDAFEYVFGLDALYIIGTPVFATYHLFFLFIFILLWGSTSFPLPLNRVRLALLVTTVLVLIPKNYATFHTISLDGELNPLCLLIALALIFWNRRRDLPGRVAAVVENRGEGAT
jgi:hypothetical protein